MAPVLAGTALEEEEEENSNPSGCVEPSLCWEPWLPLGFWWFFFFLNSLFHLNSSLLCHSLGLPAANKHQGIAGSFAGCLGVPQAKPGTHKT